jgi:hypothetical protein
MELASQRRYGFRSIPCRIFWSRLLLLELALEDGTTLGAQIGCNTESPSVERWDSRNWTREGG